MSFTRTKEYKLHFNGYGYFNVVDFGDHKFVKVDDKEYFIDIVNHSLEIKGERRRFNYSAWVKHEDDSFAMALGLIKHHIKYGKNDEVFLETLEELYWNKIVVEEV